MSDDSPFGAEPPATDHQILRDVHRDLKTVRDEVALVKDAAARAATAASKAHEVAVSTGATSLDAVRMVEATVHSVKDELGNRLIVIEKQTMIANGRTSALETWKSELVSKQREHEAYRAGAATSWLTKRQAAAIGGIAMGMTAFASAIVGIIAKL